MQICRSWKFLRFGKISQRRYVALYLISRKRWYFFWFFFNRRFSFFYCDLFHVSLLAYWIRIFRNHLLLKVVPRLAGVEFPFLNQTVGFKLVHTIQDVVVVVSQLDGGQLVIFHCLLNRLYEILHHVSHSCFEVEDVVVVHSRWHEIIDDLITWQWRFVLHSCCMDLEMSNPILLWWASTSFLPLRWTTLGGLLFAFSSILFFFTV